MSTWSSPTQEDIGVLCEFWDDEGEFDEYDFNPVVSMLVAIHYGSSRRYEAAGHRFRFSQTR